MYADDNNDRLVPNNPPNIRGPDGKPFASWSLGDMRYGRPDGTNIDYLIGQREGSLGPYVKTHKIFKCPSDHSTTIPADGKAHARVRSYGMNGFMGTLANWPGPALIVFTRGDLARSPRPELLVFIDEHEDSVQSSPYSLARDIGYEAWEYPAARHARSGLLSLTDGHAEIHRWRDERTFVPVTGTYANAGPAHNVTGSQDWRFLWERMTKSTAAVGDP